MTSLKPQQVWALTREQMKRKPTDEEFGKIADAIAAGDRIEATSLYISVTECGLTEAQEFIKARTNELKADNPERFAPKQKKKRWF